MEQQRIKIGETNDEDIAYALAYLAGFREGTRMSKIGNIWHRELSLKCIVVFHKKTLEKVDGNLCEAIAYHGPDIIVSQIYKRPENNHVFQQSDEYLIDFNEKIIDGSLIKKIEEEIKLAYSQI